MKHIHLTMLVAAFLTAVLVTSCKQSKSDEKEAAAVENAVEKPDLRFLKDLNGKYPKEVNLFENADFTQRVKDLVGDRYDFFIENWNVESPVIYGNNTFIASACQAHNCAETNFIIVYNFTKKVMYAGIRENGDAKTYAEDGSTSPQIVHWAEPAVKVEE